ncbi:MAG: hypothetical protein BMS9Abin12_0112 [Acidimicrobiia bacterium]|nr:MAG: hypothetical protein BMS9Abin12_0112 [Acidimicrobiia bacterium]
MCHVSVGHVARAVEESGIPTVTIMVKAFEHRATELKIPRTIIVKHPMGRPLGAAGDSERQRDVVDAALALLESAATNATVVELPGTYRPRPRSQNNPDRKA